MRHKIGGPGHVQRPVALAYGLLWRCGCYWRTGDGEPIYQARQALLAQLAWRRQKSSHSVAWINAAADLHRGHLVELWQRWVGTVPGMSAHGPHDHLWAVTTRIIETCGADEEQRRHGRVRRIDRLPALWAEGPR